MDLTKEEINERLKNFEILTFTNDTDVFEFKFSELRKCFRTIRNGKLLNKKCTLQDVLMTIRFRDLKFEEF